MRVRYCGKKANKTPVKAPVVGTGGFIGAVADIRGENQATAPPSLYGRRVQVAEAGVAEEDNAGE